MQIKLKNTEAQVELVKAMASKNRDVAYEAQAAVADLMPQVISKVINNAPSISNLYTNMSFGEDENPSFPLDLLYDITDEDYVQIWSQSAAGGLATNEFFPAHDELKFKTFTLDSAWSMDKKYARKARLDVVSALFTRISQELLLKRERTALNQLCGALVTASTKINGTSSAGNHVIAAGTANQLTIDDFNNLLTRSKRLWSSFSTGTPSDGARFGVTDLLMSPEMTEEIRAMAYQPVNTRSGAVTTSGATSIPATEQMRNEIMASAGLSSLFGVTIVELLEFGINQRYNKIFDAINIANSSPVTFTQANDEVILGINKGIANALVRPTITQEGASSEFNVSVDDQFVGRSGKIGYYSDITEGYYVLESRALTGLTV